MLNKIIFSLFISVFLLGLSLFLWISDLFLSVWDKLALQPPLFFYSYLVLFIIFIALFGLFLYKLFPKSKLSSLSKKQKEGTEAIVEINEVDIEQRIEKLNEQNIDVSQIEQELAELKQTQKEQNRKDIYMVLFGNISSGKSSLINAILPKAEGEVSVVGGTTRDIHEYKWTSPMGEQLFLIDTPGFDEYHRLLDKMATASVYKSHLAIYLCEGDLTATQYQQIKEVAGLNKPLIVAFNKTDRYKKNELDQITERLKQRLDSISKQISLVLIQSGGSKEVTLLLPDGSEKKELRALKPDLKKLLKQVSKVLEKNSLSELDLIRHQSVLQLLSKNLQTSEYEYQQQKAQEIVKSSTQKAMIAAMAAIAPGADLLIQGYLGLSMVRSLCENYHVSVKDVDIEKMLKILQSNTIGVFPLLLGVAGNGFKAFPGFGTVAGGFMHAVAYGLIFDSVGKAVQLSLSTRGDLSPILIEDVYKEKLVENVESRALELVKMVIRSKKGS